MSSRPFSPALPAAGIGDGRGRLAAVVCFISLLLPWLNPFASGPSSWVAPWLFSVMCAAVAFGVSRPAAPHPGVAAVLAGLAAWGVLRSGWSPETLALTVACLLVWMMAALAAGERRPAILRAIALSWLIAAVVSTAAALLQYFRAAEGLAPWITASAAGEAFANLRQRNQFATLTVIGTAALLWLPPRNLRRWQAVVAIVWLALGNAATTSRTGLVEFLLLGAAAWWWAGGRSDRTTLWLAGLASYIIGMIGLPLLAQAATGAAPDPLWLRVTGIDPCGSRLVLWSNVLDLIAQRPWVGWGWAELDFAHYATLYEGRRFCDILDNAHNLPLHLAVELGVPAALAVGAAFLWAVARARLWREADQARQMAWSVLLVFGVHSLLEYPLWYGPFQIALGLCLGLLWPAAPAPDQNQPGPTHAAGTALLSVAVLAAAGYAAWDYGRASQVYLPPDRRDPDWRQDPLARLGGSWLFRGQVRFAELTLAPLTRNNARWTFDTANQLLHYSPEPRVIEKVIASGSLLGREADVLWHLARFRAAFPEDYAAWSQANRAPRR